jgi:hypothetical protein
MRKSVAGPHGFRPNRDWACRFAMIGLAGQRSPLMLQRYQAASSSLRTTAGPSIFRGFVCTHRSCIEPLAIASN